MADKSSREDDDEASKSIWGDFHAKIWKEWLSPFLDVKAYMKRRSEIIQSIDSRNIEKSIGLVEQGSPLRFAVQGALIILIIIKIINLGFSSIFKPPERIVLSVSVGRDAAFESTDGPKKYFKITSDAGEIFVYSKLLPTGESVSQFMIDQGDRDLKYMESQLDRINKSSPTSSFPKPPDYANRDIPSAFIIEAASAREKLTKSDASAEYRRQIKIVQEKIDRYKLRDATEKISEAVADYLPAIQFLAAAYLFGLFSRIGRRNYTIQGKEYEFFL